MKIPWFFWPRLPIFTDYFINGHNIFYWRNVLLLDRHVLHYNEILLFIMQLHNWMNIYMFICFKIILILIICDNLIIYDYFFYDNNNNNKDNTSISITKTIFWYQCKYMHLFLINFEISNFLLRSYWEATIKYMYLYRDNFNKRKLLLRNSSSVHCTWI